MKLGPMSSSSSGPGSTRITRMPAASRMADLAVEPCGHLGAQQSLDPAEATSPARRPRRSSGQRHHLVQRLLGEQVGGDRRDRTAVEEAAAADLAPAGTNRGSPTTLRPPRPARPRGAGRAERDPLAGCDIGRDEPGAGCRTQPSGWPARRRTPGGSRRRRGRGEAARRAPSTANAGRCRPAPGRARAAPAPGPAERCQGAVATCAARTGSAPSSAVEGIQQVLRRSGRTPARRRSRRRPSCRRGRRQCGRPSPSCSSRARRATAVQANPRVPPQPMASARRCVMFRILTVFEYQR